MEHADLALLHLNHTLQVLDCCDQPPDMSEHPDTQSHSLSDTQGTQTCG